MREASYPYEPFRGFCLAHRRTPQPRYRALRPRHATTTGGEGVRTEGLKDEGEDLCDGRTVKSSFIVVEDVQVRHTHIVVDYSRIVRNIQKHKGLSGRDIPILDALANYV